MKNVLRYYYNLHLEDIHQNDGIYRFEWNGIHYAFLLYNRDLEELEDLYNLSVNLIQSGIYSHQFVFNKDNQLITYVNQKPYILFQLYHYEKQMITIEEIKQFSFLSTQIIQPEKLKRNNWADLWSSKIDYFEYQVNQFGKKNSLIRESFSYFSGLVENGISLFQTIELDDIELSVCHRRIKMNDTLFEFYNPLNFIIDYKVRDACEYFKEKFKSNGDSLNEIIDYLTDKHLTGYELLLFYIRLFYPSFYFDQYEHIINNQKDDYVLKDTISLVNQYENLLKQLYRFLSQYIIMPDIEWIKKT